mgnify:CR=1 FL=1
MDSDFQVKVVDFQAKLLEVIQISFKSPKLLLSGRSFVRLLIKCPWNVFRMSANLSELPPKRIHLIPKWRPINYSFVCMLISPLRLIFTTKFFCFLHMLTRPRGLINMQAKEFIGRHFGIRCMCLQKILIRYYTIFIEIILTSYPAQNRYITIERLIKVIGKFTFKIN